MNKLIEIFNCDRHWGIGKRNGLLFRLPKDMAFFRKTTEGHAVAMGENTLLSFPHSTPLKNRINLVLAQDPSHEYPGTITVHSFEDFLFQIRKQLQNGDVFVIGGASIYRQMLPYCDEALVTRVEDDGGAEVFVENLDESPDWSLLLASEKEEDNGHIIQFCRYENRNKKAL